MPASCALRDAKTLLDKWAHFRSGGGEGDQQVRMLTRVYSHTVKQNALRSDK